MHWVGVFELVGCIPVNRLSREQILNGRQSSMLEAVSSVSKLHDTLPMAQNNAEWDANVSDVLCTTAVWAVRSTSYTKHPKVDADGVIPSSGPLHATCAPHVLVCMYRTLEERSRLQYRQSPAYGVVVVWLCRLKRPPFET